MTMNANEENETDNRIRSAFSNLKAPDALRSQILREAQKIFDDQSGAIATSSPRRFNPIIWVPMAALFAIGLFMIGAFFLMKNNRALDSEVSFAAATTEFIADGYFLLDYTSDSLEQIKTHLGSAAPLPPLPKSLLTYEPMGCKTLRWGEETAYLLCFRVPSGGLAHFFVTDGDESASAQILDRTHSNDPRFRGSWHYAGKTIVLVGSDADTKLAATVSEINQLIRS